MAGCNGARVRGYVGALVLIALTGATVPLDAQRGRGAGAGAPQTGRAAAPRDITGYWVSVVTEHWHLRMRMPPKGDYSMLPLNAEARKAADAWDPARDAADGGQCRAYGAASLMRLPGRIHIHWVDDNTLQLDADSGTQTRTFHFGNASMPPVDGPPQWQGYSRATWGAATPSRGRGNGVNANTLRVVTTRMRPGYLRRNGVPYSEDARLEEHFETFTEPNGDQWLIVTSIVTDPRYLTGPYVTTYPFKKIPDRAGWDPTPCRVDEPR